MTEQLDSDPLAALEQLHELATHLEETLVGLKTQSDELLASTRGLVARVARLERLWDDYPDADDLDAIMTWPTPLKIEPKSPDCSEEE